MEIGAPELIIILIVVLLIFGPGRIVKVVQELGTGIRRFKQELGMPTDEKEKPKQETSSDA